MIRLYAAEGAGLGPRRLAECGATTHNWPLEGGHQGNPGLSGVDVAGISRSEFATPSKGNVRSVRKRTYRSTWHRK
jgi:hypothetical protein